MKLKRCKRIVPLDCIRESAEFSSNPPLYNRKKAILFVLYHKMIVITDKIESR